jgi:hypothetical protein
MAFMARQLRDADTLVMPALRRSLAALRPPAEDDAVVALAMALGEAIDGMVPAVRSAMIAQVSGQLLKTLAELDRRAVRRGEPQPGRPSRLDQLRAARASGARPGFL